MSDTIVDLPKVTQMLDAGWRVELFKNPMKSYSAIATHDEDLIVLRTRARLIDYARDKLLPGFAEAGITVEDHVDDFHFDHGDLLTDDFTPEQALTRLAYKAVDGRIL